MGTWASRECLAGWLFARLSGLATPVKGKFPYVGGPNVDPNLL